MYRPCYVELKNDNVSDKVSDKVKLSENAIAILRIISVSPSITRKELTEIIKKSESTINRAIKELKNGGYILKKTFDKNGEWIINKSTNINLNNLESDQDTDQDTEQDTEQDIEQDTEQVTMHNKIVEYCSNPKTLKEIMEYFNYKHRPSFIKKYLRPLLEEEKIRLTIPDKPNSKNQKYVKK